MASVQFSFKTKGHVLDPAIDEGSSHPEMLELPEKPHRANAFSVRYRQFIGKEGKPSAWKWFERTLPVAVLLLGLANLGHALILAHDTESYRERYDLTEARKRYIDLLFVLNGAMQNGSKLDQITMHGLLSQLNELAEEPRLHGSLHVADFISLANINGQYNWDEMRVKWYNEAFQVADRDMQIDRRSALVAKLYRASLMLDSRTKTVDPAAIQQAIELYRATIRKLDPNRDNVVDLRFSAHLWFANALFQKGLYRSCTLNLQIAQRISAEGNWSLQQGSPQAVLFDKLSKQCPAKWNLDKSGQDFVI